MLQSLQKGRFSFLLGRKKKKKKKKAGNHPQNYKHSQLTIF